ncbi:MAG: hypothetical protein IJT18_07150 [Oscillospiraceae bacterium]|nr:hypothetical protein [Oscillospiraceae bacterium]
MKKRCLAMTALLPILAILLSACGFTPTETPTEPPTAAVEQTIAAPTETEPAQPAEQEAWGRPLEANELDALAATLKPEENGFFVTTFDRPEEIDWESVCYDGAGLAPEPDDALRAKFEQREGEIFTDVIAVPVDALDAFAEKKTGVPYRLARNPIWSWTYLADDGLYCIQHGDTNYEPITFTSGAVDGDLYRLVYTRSDMQHFRQERPFEMTARITDGEWQYLSNVPADAPRPAFLAQIDYTEELPDGELADTYEVRMMARDEPGTVWATVTAQTDGVTVALERVEYSEEFDVMYPTRELNTWTLNEGERIALNVNLPWHPSLRLTAVKDDLRGSYIFGEDNWLHFDFDVPRYIMGHDLVGEGLGAEPKNETELVNFLSYGDWVCFDESTHTPIGAVEFMDYRDMWIGGYLFRIEYAHGDKDQDNAPDMLYLKHSDAEAGEPLPEDFPSAIGTYRITARQNDGEQRLQLTPLGGDGALGYLVPQSCVDGVFILRRFP